MSAGSLYLKQMELGPMQNFVYLVGDREAGECVAVDPAWELDTLVRTAEADGMTIKGALITHTHPDHVYGLPALVQGLLILRRSTPLPIYCRIEHVELIRSLLDLFELRAAGLEVRVPICDHRLFDYVYNVPWSIRAFDGREAGARTHLEETTVGKSRLNP